MPQCQTVLCSGGNGHDIIQAAGNAGLAKGVPTPRIYRSIMLKGQAMISACGDGLHAAQHGGRNMGLAIGIPAPGHDPAIRHESYAMMMTRRDVCHVRKP